MTSYPFVQYKNDSSSISGQKEMIFGSQFTCMLDGIWVVNKQDQEIFCLAIQISQEVI